MSNMSYCRFHNTSGDLQDCIDALDNFENHQGENDEEHGISNLSSSERQKADDLYQQCRTYMEIYERETEDE